MTEAVDPHRHLEPAERELGARLDDERAVPRSEFRRALGRRIAAEAPGYRPRPERLRATVALYLGLGGAFAGIGLLQALGMM
jgi:hypothetical protein